MEILTPGITMRDTVRNEEMDNIIEKLAKEKLRWAEQWPMDEKGN